MQVAHVIIRSFNDVHPTVHCLASLNQRKCLRPIMDNRVEPLDELIVFDFAIIVGIYLIEDRLDLVNSILLAEAMEDVAQVPKRDDAITSLINLPEQCPHQILHT